MTFHCRGITSSVSVTSSPSLRKIPPQHGQAAGPGRTTRSRGRCAGNGARTGLRRVKPRTTVSSWAALEAAISAAISSSAAVASSSSSCSSSWSRILRPRSDDGPKRSRFILAMTSFRCLTIASAPEARASAISRAARSAASAAFRASMSSGSISRRVVTPGTELHRRRFMPPKTTRRFTSPQVSDQAACQPASCGRHVNRGWRQSIPSSM